MLQHQRSLEDIQQLRAWYKIRDTLFGQNGAKRDRKKALELASVCQHPNAVWLTKIFAGREVNTEEVARQVFLGCEDPRALCFAGLFGWEMNTFVELLILAMRLPKRRWQCELVMKSVFVGLKNLLPKENARVSSCLVVASNVGPGA